VICDAIHKGEKQQPTLITSSCIAVHSLLPIILKNFHLT